MKKCLLIITLLLTACHTVQPVKGTAVDDINRDLQTSIANNRVILNKDLNQQKSQTVQALLPSLRVHSPHIAMQERRFDIGVKNMPAQKFFMGIVADTPLNMVVSPGVTGFITLSLKQVTVEEVLQTVEDIYGYNYNPIPGGYEILPNSLKTQIYRVNYLELQRMAHSNMTLSSGEVTGGGGQGAGSAAGGASTLPASTGSAQNINNSIGDVQTHSVIDFWKSLQTTLQNIIGTAEGRSVTVNPVAGIVVVRALPKELKQVRKYLDLVQNSMDKQVMLEAKILEVNLKNEFQMGIDWKLFGARLNALDSITTGAVNLANSGFSDGMAGHERDHGFGINARWNPNDFTSYIRALETQGHIQVLSSPRVSALNNQKAALKVGTDEFFVTNVSQNQNIISSGLATQPTVNVNLTPFFSGITLDVTPQIDASGQVTLHVHPSVSLVTNQQKVIDLGSQGGVLNLPLASSTIRESDTIVHAKNGQVVVIGGLMQNSTGEGVAQLPWVGNVPFLGSLVRRTKQNSVKTELVILLKATIVNQKSTIKDMTESDARLASLKRGFHFGDRPDIYGTQGEVGIPLGAPSKENLNWR